MVTSRHIQIVRVRHPAPGLLDLLAKHDSEAFGQLGLRECDLAVVAEAGALYLGYVGMELVGSFQLLRMVDDPDFFYVVGFYLRPPWRGRGLGREFLAGMIEETTRLGGEGLVLTVSPSNAAALRLYREAGFVEERLVHDYYGDGEERYVLRLRFSGVGLPGSV